MPSSSGLALPSEAPERSQSLGDLNARPVIEGLDGIRALAVFAVLLYHVEASWSEFPVIAPIAKAGWLGVDIFFTLSGFLITWVLLREIRSTGRIRITHFYLRRFLRLVPAYLIFIAATWIAVKLFGTIQMQENLAKGLPYLFTYTSNFAAAQGLLFPLSLHSWSLAVEEQFYLLFPILLAFVPNRRFVGAILATIIIATATTRWIGMHYWPFGWPATIGGHLSADIYFLTPFRIDSILVGCLAAVLLEMPTMQVQLRRSAHREAPWIAIWACWAVAIVWFGPKGTNAPVYRYGLPIIYLLSATVILGVYLGRPRFLMPALRHRWIARVGQISYGIYLLHVLVINVVEVLLESLHMSALSYAILLTALSATVVIAVAEAQYRLLERPFLELKRRLGATRARQ